MVGLAPDAGAFGRFCLVFFIMNFAAQSLGYLASSFSANPLVGLSILPLLTTPMILFSGMLYERNSVPHSLKWIQDLSIVNYGFALLVINQVEHVNPQARNFLLNFLQVKESDYPHFMINLVVLSVCYRLAAMMILYMRVKYLAKAQ
jgi:ABC-type multidrug transport system permease subunit